MTDNITPGQVTHLRACAHLDTIDSWPTYGSLEWLQLPQDDPRYHAAILEAAERHRDHTENIYGYAHRRAFTTLKEAAVARTTRKNTMRTRPAHQLTATPGWPPIRVPGKPGIYLTPENSA